ncbi:MANS1 protein, partial [Penelope pileata]|nr:MANS1 protein [Penelope pileata]
LLAVTCAVPAPSPSRGCPTERVDNAIIDINLSLPRGVRGTEPVRTATAEACIRACCLGKKLSGDKKCNFVIFDARRTSAHPNCYLFHCPSTEACPMKPAVGLVSYRIAQDTHALEDTSFKHEDFNSNEYSVPLDAGASISHSQASHQNHTTALQQSVFHQASELLNHVAKHLDNTEFHTIFPESQREDNPESLDLMSRQKVINPLPSTSFTVQIGNPSALVAATQANVPNPSSTTVTPLPTSTVRLESYTNSLPAGGVKPSTVTTTTIFMLTAIARAESGIPAAGIAVTHLPLSSPTASTTKWVTSNSVMATTSAGLRTSSIPPGPTVFPANDTSHVTILSFSNFALSNSGSLKASQSNHQDYDLSDSETYLSENVQRRKGFVQLEDKSRLVAALLFGVIFLLLVIALIGKKMLESLQKRQYTRLDYLINGMYADV